MPGPSLGTNLTQIADWTTAFPFIDLFRASRPWFTQDADAWDSEDAGLLDLDSDGWIRSFTKDGAPASFDRVSTVWTTAANMLREGRYVVTWEGEGEIEIHGVRVVSRSDHRLVIDPDATDTIVTLSLLSTDPGGTGDYVRDIHIVHEQDQALLDAGEVFNPAFLDRIQDFRVLRFMDWMEATTSEVRHWSEATPIGSPRQSTYGDAGTGASVDVMVALANQVGADPWFNLPIGATDSYVRSFVRYVREHLDPALVARFEFGNEVWNINTGAGRFAEARAEELWGPNVEIGWMQWYGMRAAEVARIVASVYGDETGERALNVFSTQAVWQGLEAYGLDAPAFVAQGGAAPRTAPFHVYAIAPYFGVELGQPEMAKQVDEWMDQGEAGFRAALAYLAEGEVRDSLARIGSIIAYHAGAAHDLGWQLEGYEGGQGIRDRMDEVYSARDQFFVDLVARPEMADLYQLFLDAWKDAGGGLMVQYLDFGIPNEHGSWGLWSSPYTPDTSRAETLGAFRDGVPAWWGDDRPASVFDGVHVAADYNATGTLKGTGGRDRLHGLDGGDSLSGAAGADRLYGGKGSDWLYGGSSNDRLYGGTGMDRLQGSSGNDLLEGGTNADGMAGGTGDDLYLVDSAWDRVAEAAGEGRDTVRSVVSFALPKAVEALQLLGTATMGLGNAADNRIVGQAIANTLSGEGGNDALWGGRGADILRGGSGRDRLGGDSGADGLYGGDGADSMQGGSGNDRLDGGAGDDRLYGGSGLDRLKGGGNRDRMSGGAADDALSGGSGDDRLDGGTGDDRLYGGGGRDVLWAGAGSDRADGGSDASRDIFVFAAANEGATGAGRDVLLHFVSGIDLLDLRGIDARPEGPKGDDAFAWGGRRAGDHAVSWSAATAGVVLRADLDGDPGAEIEVLLADVERIDRGDVLL